MNYRVVIVSGLVTAMLGSVFGWGMGQVALRRHRSQIQISMSRPYQELYRRRMVWFGAIAGFVLGAGQATVLGEKKRVDEEEKLEQEKVEE